MLMCLVEIVMILVCLVEIMCVSRRDCYDTHTFSSRLYETYVEILCETVKFYGGPLDFFAFLW